MRSSYSPPTAPSGRGSCQMKAALLLMATGRLCLLLIASSRLPPCGVARFLPCDQTTAATVFAAVTKFALFPATLHTPGFPRLNPLPAAEEAQIVKSVGVVAMPFDCRLARMVKWSGCAPSVFDTA